MNFILGLTTVVVAVSLIVCIPLSGIWALNHLFLAGSLKYDFPTWCAMYLIIMIIRGKVTL